MRPPYGGPGPQGPMPPFHGGPPMEQKKEPSKWKFNLLFTYAYLNVHLVFDLITQVCFSTYLQLVLIIWLPALSKDSLDIPGTYIDFTTTITILCTCH